MKKTNVLLLYPNVAQREVTRPHGGDELINGLIERVTSFNPRKAHLADMLDDITATLHQCSFSETSLRALLTALQQSSYRNEPHAPTAQHLVWLQIENMVEEDLKGTMMDQICDLIYALRSEQSDEVRRGIDLTDWFFIVQNQYDDLSVYNRTWGESLRFALFNSVSIVPIAEKERILTIVKTHAFSQTIWGNYLLNFAGNCKMDVIDWLEDYFHISGLERYAWYRDKFYTAIQWNKEFAKDHPFIPGETERHADRYAFAHRHHGRSGSGLEII